uniref:Uncharacterized protein n=1 Tax=Anguilla anguilla TaxID=7936 RepID=A0A0E9PYQ7_ANGAN
MFCHSCTLALVSVACGCHKASQFLKIWTVFSGLATHRDWSPGDRRPTHFPFW